MQSEGKLFLFLLCLFSVSFCFKLPNKASVGYVIVYYVTALFFFRIKVKVSDKKKKTF